MYGNTLEFGLHYLLFIMGGHSNKSRSTIRQQRFIFRDDTVIFVANWIASYLAI